MAEDNGKSHDCAAEIVAREEIINYVNSSSAQKFIITPLNSEESFNAALIASAKVISKEAKMLASAKKAVFQSTTWIARNDFQTILMIASEDAATPEGLLEDGRIFAIEVDGEKLFPFYALDPSLGFLPHKVLAEILNIFGRSKSGWELAFWFSSVSGFLGGQRPQDLIINYSERILAAAQDYACGITHG